MPDESTFRSCFDSNPHGAGYMFRRNKIVHVRKGFMTIEAFLADVSAQHITKKDDVVFHFRIATHSVVSPINTHPFPITTERKDLHELTIDCKRALVHNGILYDFVDRTDDISDSAFFAKMLYPCQRESQYKAVMGCHNRSSKFVVMTSKFTVLSGDFIKHAGCHFSNGGFRTYQVKPTWTTSMLGGEITNTSVYQGSATLVPTVRITDLDDTNEKYPTMIYDDEYWDRIHQARKAGFTVDKRMDAEGVLESSRELRRAIQRDKIRERKTGDPFFAYLTGDTDRERGIYDKQALSLLSKNGLTTVLVDNLITKDVFCSVVAEGSTILIDGKPFDKMKHGVYHLYNARGITEKHGGNTEISVEGGLYRFFRDVISGDTYVYVRKNQSVRENNADCTGCF